MRRGHATRCDTLHATAEPGNSGNCQAVARRNARRRSKAQRDAEPLSGACVSWRGGVSDGQGPGGQVAAAATAMMQRVSEVKIPKAKIIENDYRKISKIMVENDRK